MTMKKSENSQAGAVDDREIELVYNQFKSELGNAVVKSLNEVVGFKNKIERIPKNIGKPKGKGIGEPIEKYCGTNSGTG